MLLFNHPTSMNAPRLRATLGIAIVAAITIVAGLLYFGNKLQSSAPAGAASNLLAQQLGLTYEARINLPMIRHASPSRTITATSGGVHGATTWSCLIAPPSFLLIVAAGFLRAGSDAVNMTSITPATDKDLRAAASTQKHSARNFIDTCGSASPALRITALCIYRFWQYSTLRPLAHLFTTRWPPQGGIPRSRSTGSPTPPRFSFPANSIDPTAVDISSPLRLTPSIRGSSQPFTPGELELGDFSLQRSQCGPEGSGDRLVIVW